jgi:hypothetical protein
VLDDEVVGKAAEGLASVNFAFALIPLSLARVIISHTVRRHRGACRVRVVVIFGRRGFPELRFENSPKSEIPSRQNNQ